MSDTPQGPGWWQASDGKWYPPEQAPGAQPAGSGGAAGDTDVGSTLTYAWNKFVQNIGEWIILWLIFLAVAVLFAVLAFTLAVGGAVTTSIRFNATGLVLGIIGGAVQGVLLVVLARAAVMAVNGQRIDVAAAFKLTSNNILAGVVFGLIYGVLNSLCGVLGVVAFLFLGFLPVLSALDDKGAEALGESLNLATGHASEAMVFWLIGWVITACTCGIGSPIAMLGGTYLVKRYRGEPVAA
ncbi:MAG: hypothetical protein WHS89_11120 [Acidimicrobiales bacterium]